MSVTIGIDLGTTNSLCSIFVDGSPQLIRNAHGNFLTPSVVGVLQSGEVVVGAAARELRITHPDRCVSMFKRWMGTEKKVRIASHQFTPTELSSLVLRSLKQDAEKHLGVEVRQAVITVPAYFNDHQRQATKLAGQLAGLEVRRIINEPTAAALVYGYHDRAAEKKLIVIDLGGGTFDVTLMEVFEGTLEIISTAGETQLGGEDFTTRLVGWALAKVGKQLETTELQAPLQVARLREECETAKRALADVETTNIRIPSDSGEFSSTSPTVAISKAVFTEVVDPLVKRLARPILRALRDGETEIRDVSEVVLVGGATRSFAVRSYVEELFGCAAKMEFNPDEVVALGAAVQAALMENNAAVEDMVMTDICPFSLGVEISRELGRQELPGYFLPIIHRNTTIPVSREETVCTTSASQREVTVKIYQGESRRVKDNLLLGELRVLEIPPGPEGQRIHLRFTYDLNGILEVEAVVAESGKKFQTILTNHARQLSKHEMAEAIERLRALKFYPRDDIQNQHLLLFAERVVGEVNQYEREVLDNAVNAFEASFSMGDREYFQQARELLIATLEQLGFPLPEE